MKLLCTIGIHSWSYSTPWCRTCHNCKRIQRKAGWNGEGMQDARLSGLHKSAMRLGWHYTPR